MASSKTEIGTLHVRSERPSAGLRLRLSSLLGAAELQPSCLPPAAVMIVRRMADPAPGRLSVDRIGARLDPAWEQAARAGIEQSYRSAARPSDGPIPAAAEAVLFADEVEMIACLLIDMSRQEARQQWWWRTLLSDLPDAGAAGMTMLLHRRATQVPAVLQQLVDYGQAIDVIRALALAQALAVVTAMAQAYGVSLPLQPATTTPLSGSPAPIPTPPIEAREMPVQPDHRLAPSVTPAASATCAAPWREWLSDSLSVADLSKEQACLLGVGLGLRRAPAVVRSSAFLRRVQDWWLAAAAPPVQSRPSSSRIEPPFDATEPTTNGLVPSSRRMRLGHIPVSSPPFQGGVARSAGMVRPDSAPLVNKPPDSAADDVVFPPSLTENVGAKVPTPPDPTRRSEQVEQLPAASLAPSQTDQRSREAITPAPPVVQSDSAPPPAADFHAAVERHSRSDPVPSSPAAAPEASGPVPMRSQLDESATVSSLSADGVTTALGGVWYLINLMVYLDLPDCFEDDWRLATRLGAWGTLEALARALLSDSDATWLDDPLWPALLELGGRQADEPLGAELPPDRDFRLPTPWLAGSDEAAAYAWAADGRRLRLWSTQGYLLAEVACGSVSAASRAMAELRRYRLVRRRRRVRPTHQCPLVVRCRVRPMHQRPVYPAGSTMVRRTHPTELVRGRCRVRPTHQRPVCPVESTRVRRTHPTELVRGRVRPTHQCPMHPAGATMVRRTHPTELKVRRGRVRPTHQCPMHPAGATMVRRTHPTELKVRRTHPTTLKVRRTHPTKLATMVRRTHPTNLRCYLHDDSLVLQQRRFADAPLAQLGGSLTVGLSPALKRWLSLAVPTIRQRLRRALADDDEADRLNWLQQPGQLYVTSTHVDLVMSLDSVSIPLRLAGLDRDPGWLPDFGRIIRFHFD